MNSLMYRLYGMKPIMEQTILPFLKAVMILTIIIVIADTNKFEKKNIQNL